MTDPLVTRAPKLRIVEDENKDVRNQLYAKAKRLDQLLFFENTQKPKQHKMMRSLLAFQDQITKENEKIDELKKSIEEEKANFDKKRPDQISEESIQSKCDRIRFLEEEYRNLLETKENLLAKLKDN